MKTIHPMFTTKRLRKQPDGTLRVDAHYSYKFTWQKKQILRKTPFTNRRDAQSAGHDHLHALQAGKWEIANALRLRRDPTTVPPTPEEYLRTYENTPTGESSPASRHHAANAMRRILTRFSPFPTLDLGHLTTAFRAQHAHTAARIEAAVDQRTALTAKISHNSELRNAISVFSHMHTLPTALTSRLPELDPLRKIIKTELYFKIPNKLSQTREHPTPEVLQHTLDAWQTLAREPFILVSLAITFGLRAGETTQVRGDWLRTRDGHHYLDNESVAVTVKDQTGQLSVRALDPFYTIFHGRLHREGWYRDSELLEPGHDRLIREISAWMVNLGWKTKKKLHALRDYASTLVACRYDLLAARDFCRHASVTTTERHYTSLVKKLRPADHTTMTVLGQPVEWARAATIFTPQIA